MVVLAVWLAGGRGAAQGTEEAESLLAKAYDTYAAFPNLEVTIATRELHAVGDRMPRQGGPASEREPRILNEAYQRVWLTRRQPDDWRVVSQRERVSNGQTQPDRTLAFARLGTSDGEVMMLNASTGEPVKAPVPAEIFRQEVVERVGPVIREDSLAAALFFNRSETGARAFGLQEASVAGREVWNGVDVARVTAKTTQGMTVTLWIDTAAGLLLRRAETPPSNRYGSMVRVKESLYRHDFTRGATAADFDLAGGWALASPGIAASAGFVSHAEMLALLKESADRPPSMPGSPITPGVPPTPELGPRTKTRPDAPVVAEATPAQARPEPVMTPIEGQLLTPEQMEAIVLVDGDEGVGTGFIAKIRGVDFVVTNLHVIGGNASIRVTTVRGTPVQVAGMFGAAGRDIAILRIVGEHQGPTLKLAENPISTVKLGDKVVVVGNRRGGGVATQVSGEVQGIGPDRLEVNARFQPGNSGSPIVHVPTGEVIGVASYSQTRELDELDGPGEGNFTTGTRVTKEEQRWFGYRADAVSRWEAIDLAKWRAQAKKIADFEADSQAIHYAMYGRFKEAGVNQRVRVLTDRFEERYERMGASQVVVGQEVQELFRGLRALADNGVKDLKTGDYYDFFRTSLYWETSITQQLRAREEIAKRLDKASENSAAFLARVRR